MIQLSKEDGLKIAIKQIAYYASSWFEKYDQREAFTSAATEVVVESYTTAKTGFDVKRGVEIERIAYRALGKTEKEFSDFLASQD